MNRAKIKGYTIVEVLVVIVVISILSGLTLLAYTQIRTDANDSSRNNKARIIAEALEKYYDKNKEYPTIASVADREADAVQAKLGIADIDVLLFPGREDDLSAIVSSAPTTSTLQYSAQSEVNNEGCIEGGGCDSFKLTYLKESDGSPVEIKSRRSTAPVPSPDPVIPQPPSAPVIATDPTANSVELSWNQSSGTKPITYQVSYKTSAATVYTSFTSCNGTGLTCEVTGLAQSTTYDFKVIATNSYGSAEGTATETTQLNTPQAPQPVTINNASNSTSTTWTWGVATCSVGSRQYQYEYNYQGGVVSSYLTTAQNVTYTTNSQGQAYTVKVKARCVNGSLNSAWSAQTSSTYTRPISSTVMAGSGESMLFVPQNQPTDNNIWGRSIVDKMVGSCPSGTSAQIRWRYQFSPNGIAGQGPNIDVDGANGWKNWATTGWFVYSSDMDPPNMIEFKYFTRCKHSTTAAASTPEYSDLYGNPRVDTNRNQANDRRGSWFKGCDGSSATRSGYTDTTFCTDGRPPAAPITFRKFI